MGFDWRLLADVARDLIEQVPQSAHPEALYRSALSRLYIGAFGHARKYAVDYLGFEPREASEDHGRLRAYLRGKRRRGDADRFDLLREMRNIVDYEDELPADFNLAGKAAEGLQLARLIFLSLTPPKKVP